LERILIPPADVGCGRDNVQNEEEVLDAVCDSDFHVQCDKGYTQRTTNFVSSYINGFYIQVPKVMGQQ
jgi:hypothetical protein